MRLKKLLDPRGLKLGMVIAGLFANIAWALALFFISGALSTSNFAALMDVILVVGAFLGTFINGYSLGALAKDRRGPTYGIYAALGSFIVVLVFMRAAGFLGILVALTALLGGFNGGMWGLRTLLKRERKNRAQPSNTEDTSHG